MGVSLILSRVVDSTELAPVYRPSIDSTLNLSLDEKESRYQEGGTGRIRDPVTVTPYKKDF